MLALLRAWGGAIFVLVVGLITTARLTPRIAPGESISVSDQAFRLHLPWFVMIAAMVVVADLFHRRRSRRLLAVAPVPLLSLLGVAAAGVGEGASALTLLYLAEGVLAAVLGLFLTSLYAKDSAYPYPG